jgi:hypothetical protein
MALLAHAMATHARDAGVRLSAGAVSNKTAHTCQPQADAGPRRITLLIAETAGYNCRYARARFHDRKKVMPARRGSEGNFVTSWKVCPA